MAKMFINPKTNEFTKLEPSEVSEFYGWVPAEEYVSELVTALKNLAEAYENRMGDWENADFYDVYNNAVALVKKAKGEPVEDEEA